MIYINAKLDDIIRKTVRHGGYATVEILAGYLSDSERHIRRLLEELCEAKLLRKLELGQAKKDGNVYQVTRRACMEYGSGDSHIRRNHSPVFRARSLLRSRFLFSHAAEIGDALISFSAVKSEWFLQRGIKEADMPKKYNSGVPVVQVEETLLIGLPYADPGGVCFLCVDKEETPPYPQIKAALSRNAGIIREAYFPVSFLFLCCDPLKALAYERTFTFTAAWEKGKARFAAMSVSPK